MKDPREVVAACTASGDSPRQGKLRSSVQPGGPQEQQQMDAEQETRLQHRSKVHLGDRTGDKATCSIGPRSTHAQGG